MTINGFNEIGTFNNINEARSAAQNNKGNEIIVKKQENFSVFTKEGFSQADISTKKPFDPTIVLNQYGFEKLFSEGYEPVEFSIEQKAEQSEQVEQPKETEKPKNDLRDIFNSKFAENKELHVGRNGVPFFVTETKTAKGMVAEFNQKFGSDCKSVSDLQKKLNELSPASKLDTDNLLGPKTFAKFNEIMNKGNTQEQKPEIHTNMPSEFFPQYTAVADNTRVYTPMPRYEDMVCREEQPVYKPVEELVCKDDRQTTIGPSKEFNYDPNDPKKFSKSTMPVYSNETPIKKDSVPTFNNAPIDMPQY